MDRAEAVRILTEAGVDPGACWFDWGDPPGEGFVLSAATGGGWTVYYSERGSRSDEHTFESEEEALRHLVGRLLRLHRPNTRGGPR